MRVERRETGGRLEKHIVTGMIMSDGVLSRISSLYDSDLFETRLARTVAGWCIQYHQSYGKAPGEEVSTAFAAFVRDEKDDDFCSSVERFLINASEEAEERINSEYLLEKAEEHFNRVKLKRLSEDINAHLVQGSVEKAQASVVSFDRVQLSSKAGINPLLDMDALQDVFAERDHPLFLLPGDLGQLINPFLVRDGFIVIQGPEKRGKTWWLIELAMNALLGRCCVAFFEVGDMSRDQILPRMYSRWARVPYRLRDGEVVKYPRDLHYDEDGEVAVSYDVRSFSQPLRASEAREGMDRFLRRIRVKDRDTFQLSCHPNSSISVREIRGLLDTWEVMDGFVPDVIVIDYADILAPENSKSDFRQQVNDTWMALRALSQEKHCLVISATQAKATAYSRASQSMADFSEDKRKNAHVTGMLGLNQTENEKERKLMRLAWLLLREGFYSPRQQVYVTQCLELGLPFVQSLWRRGKGEGKR